MGVQLLKEESGRLIFGLRNWVAFPVGVIFTAVAVWIWDSGGDGGVGAYGGVFIIGLIGTALTVGEAQVPPH